MRMRSLFVAGLLLAADPTVVRSEIESGSIATKSGPAFESRERYHYRSLKGASDAELFRFMAKSRGEVDR